MGKSNSKKFLLGALSAAVASVAAGALVKKTIFDKKHSNVEKKPKEKKSSSVYYTVSLNDIYDSYNDKTFSEDDMINEIKRESSL